MKKFLACVFILLLFTGAVFYIGWTQFRVKPNQVGIVISKTNGIDDKPVLNGEFSWHWQFLLPTNASLFAFEIEPVSTVKTVTGSLPSGDAYASLYNAGNLFEYSLSFDISLTLSPESVIELMKLNKITDNEDYKEYLQGAASALAQLAADYILKRAAENPSFRPESLRREEILKGIRIYKEFPEIDVSNFALTQVKLPDYSMYKKIQELVPLDLQSHILPAALDNNASEEDENTASASEPESKEMEIINE